MYEKSLKHILYLSEITEKKITEIDELVIKLNDLLYDVSSKISKSKLDEKKPLIVFYNKIKLTIFKYYKILGKQKPPLWDGAEPHFLGIHELITSAKVSCYRAKEREKYFKDYNSPLFSYQEITDNPFSNMYTAANKLNDALKLIYVYESKIEKIFSIWNLFTNNIKENKWRI